MCLAVPGKILEIQNADNATAVELAGTVDFQGSQIQVSLAMTPEAAVGDWVLVHAGYAITILPADEARDTWEYIEFEGLGEMPAELKQPATDGPANDSRSES